MCPQLPPAAAADDVDDVATIQTDTTAQADEPAASQAIDCLPDLPMLTIFKHIPLEDLLLTIPQVSPQLASLRAEACRQRTSLTLLLDDIAEPVLGAAISLFPNLPPLDPLNTMIFLENFPGVGPTRSLARWLPNITSLTVVLFDVAGKSYLPEVISLLGAWSHQLTHLVVAFECTGDVHGSLISLQPSINRLAQLRHFTFHTDLTIFSRPKEETPFDFPVMAHLETFNCHYPEAPELFIPTLARHFVDNQLARSIDFGSQVMNDAHAFLELPPTVGRLFPRLESDAGWTPEDLPTLCLTFQGLTTFRLDLSPSSWLGYSHHLPVLASRLQALSCLTELTLAIRGDNRARQWEDTLPSDAIISALPKVTFLTLLLRGAFSSHEDLAPLRLEKMCPNLKRFAFDGTWDCLSCGLRELLKGKTEEERVGPRVACAQQVYAPIRPLFGSLELAEVSFEWYSLPNITLT